ncbi:MAG: hypothetical protein JJU11_13935 [Candidatus Sumerlaeia bacterium]|nr:hypothetical protein [Candidatus Sumerlaeia bacterium]
MMTVNDTRDSEFSRKTQGIHENGRGLWRALALSLIMMLGAAQAAAQIPINSWADLHNMRNDLSADYILMTNLGPTDLEYDDYASSSANGGQGWQPIGSPGARFTGKFDGNGYTISGLVIDRLPSNDIGFFAAIGGGGASLSNIRLEDVDVNGNINVGGLVGNMYGATIFNSHVSGRVNGGTANNGYDVGGLVGFIFSNSTPTAIILSSSSSATVSARGGLGGLVGRFESGGLMQESYFYGHLIPRSAFGFAVGMIAGYLGGNVERSYSAGTMENQNLEYVGGIGGDIEGGMIIDSYTTANIYGGNFVGGIGGRVYDPVEISRTFSAGTITALSSPIGGFIGENQSTVPFTSSYWNSDANPTLNAVAQGPSTGITGLTTEQMKHPASGGAYAGWDFDTVWNDGSDMRNDGYPYHQWQTVTFSVEYAAGPGGTIDTSSESASRLRIPGANSSITAVPDSGFSFVQWSDGVTDNPRIDTRINADINVTATFADITAPVSSLDFTANTTRAGATVSLDYTVVELGSGLDEVELYVRAPGSGSFVATGVTASALTGTFVYTGTDGNGLYEFATVAVDNDSNAEATPTEAEVSILWNLVENGDFTIEVTSSDHTTTHPMTNEIDILITIQDATIGGTITVSRTPGNNAPGTALNADALLDEYITITGDGLGTGWTATITWNFDPDNATGLDGTLDTVFQFNETTFVNQYPVTGTNPLTIGPVSTFSDWYAGDASSDVDEWMLLND